MTSEYEVKYDADGKYKLFSSADYNSVFSFVDGTLMRWGSTVDEDPVWSPFGPEIVEIEISTVCHRGCGFCYKENNARGHNMAYSTFESIIHMLPPTVNQVTLAVGDIDANPELSRMLSLLRERRISCTITINGERMTPDLYDLLAEYCSAISISLYDRSTAYTAITEFVKRGVKQLSLQVILAEEHLELIRDIIFDMLKGDLQLYSLMFVVLKPLGRMKDLHPIKDYDALVPLLDYALARGLRIGMDACSRNFQMDFLSSSVFFEHWKRQSFSCEAGSFSLYLNVDGVAFPCSLLAAQGLTGIQRDLKNFAPIWNHKELVELRTILTAPDMKGCFYDYLLSTYKSKQLEVMQ